MWPSSVNVSGSCDCDRLQLVAVRSMEVDGTPLLVDRQALCVQPSPRCAGRTGPSEGERQYVGSELKDCFKIVASPRLLVASA